MFYNMWQNIKIVQLSKWIFWKTVLGFHHVMFSISPHMTAHGLIKKFKNKFSEQTFSIFSFHCFFYLFCFLLPPLLTPPYTQFNLILLTFLSCKKNIFHLHSFLSPEQYHSHFSFLLNKANVRQINVHSGRDYRAHMQLVSPLLRRAHLSLSTAFAFRRRFLRNESEFFSIAQKCMKRRRRRNGVDASIPAGFLHKRRKLFNDYTHVEHSQTWTEQCICAKIYTTFSNWTV